jgi:deoxyribodipyrimidine photo-lyase
VVWFRLDLRLTDNPALTHALGRGAPIIPIFIWSPEDDSPWPPGAASRVWLHDSLHSLDGDLQAIGSRLILLQGSAAQVLSKFVGEVGAAAVVWNRRYEPALSARDTQIATSLGKAGIDVATFNSALLWEPWELATKAGGPFQVFTPYYRACLARGELSEPLPAPLHLPAPSPWPRSVSLSQLKLVPTHPWPDGIRNGFRPGEAGGLHQLNRFLATDIDDYPTHRDFPAQSHTARLSPHLHFGELGPRQIWHAVPERDRSAVRSKSVPEAPTTTGATEGFLRQLVWREFAHHLLFHFPTTPDRPLRSTFEHFPWRTSRTQLRAWQRGETGYPLVDAGMRELWSTGFMHNRVRMVVGSFLVKHLLISWQEGAKWFWDTLVDADLAQNTLGWQWCAGCGADAAPYFRIFNPVTQSKRFDPDGVYVRCWLPELRNLPTVILHAPWEGSATDLKAAGVVLGKTYPLPIVDHSMARQRALAALGQTRRRSPVLSKN